MELYGSPTTKELKKKHSSRLIGGAEMGSRVERTCSKARWWLKEQAVPHLRVDKPGGTTGEQDRMLNPEFQHGEIKPQNL